MKRLSYKIGVGGVDIDSVGKRFVLDALNNGRLSYGPYTEKFEQAFAEIHHRRSAIFCNSGTSALQVGFHALKKKYKWRDGAEVLVPALTFVASINTILQNNLSPIFVDIDPLYYEIDPKKIEEKITKNTVAIEPVHLFGQPCEMEPIMAIAKKYKLAVIEDSSETMFAHYKGKVTGSWGEISCFSTYAAHIITTGVGGLATADDPQLAIQMKSLINHGRDSIYQKIDDDDNKTGKELRLIVEKRFSFIDIGYSYRATELEAALGLAELMRWKSIISKRQRNALYLTKHLSPLSEFLQLPHVRPETEHVFMMYPIIIKEENIDLMDFIFYLEKKGIETRFLFQTLQQPIYKNLFGDISSNYPAAEWVSERGFYIGCHPQLSLDHLDYVVDLFLTYFKHRKP